MKNYLCALVALLSCAFAFSDEKPTSTTQMELPHHRFSIGPDVFVSYIKSDILNYDVTSNVVFGGVRLGYEYLKPQAFYSGTEGLIALGSKVSETFTYSFPMANYTYTGKITSKNNLFANIEQRFGYTFQNRDSARSTVIPFIGIGWYYQGSYRYTAPYFKHTVSNDWFYGAAGLRVNQQFCENFDVGFNLKAMYAFAGSHNKNFWGYEVALPLTWHMGEAKKWDLQLQPYLLKLDINSLRTIFGARLQVGYSF